MVSPRTTSVICSVTITWVTPAAPAGPVRPAPAYRTPQQRSRSTANSAAKSRGMKIGAKMKIASWNTYGLPTSTLMSLDADINAGINGFTS